MARVTKPKNRKTVPKKRKAVTVRWPSFGATVRAFRRSDAPAAYREQMDEHHMVGGTWVRGLRVTIVVPDEPDLDTLAHECLHAVCQVLRARDIPADTGEHEHMAYPLGWLVGVLAKRLYGLPLDG